MSLSATRLPGPRGARQLRSLRHIFRDPPSALDELRNACGPVCGLGTSPARLAVVGDPPLLRELLAMPTDRFRWGHKFNVLGFVVGPGSMIVSDGTDHHRRRSSVQTAFSRKRLNGWIPMIVERTDATIDRLIASTAGADDPIDVTPIVRTLVLTIAVHALSSGNDSPGEPMRSPLCSNAHKAYLESPAIRQLPHPFPFTARSRVRTDRRALDAIIDDEIARRRGRPLGDPLDVLEALIDDGALSDSDIRDQVVTLIGAGFDTTAASLAWMLWRSALTPKRLVAAAVRGRRRDRTSRPLGCTRPHVPSPYANRVMRETLRLHPPGVISPREAAVDIQLGDHLIPQGTLILWSAYLAGRDPNAWPLPLRFEPDRFSELTAEQQATIDRAWVPFGRAERNCIGFALAQMELTLIIARLAQRLDLTPASTTIPRPVGMVVNRPTGGASFRIELRHHRKQQAPTE